MAENEYLDSTTARRWQRVVDGVRDDCDLDELVLRTQKCFYRTLNEMCRDLPFAEWIDAIEQPDRLCQLFEQVDGAEVTKDFLLDVAREGTDQRGAIEQFLGNALQNLTYDIPHRAAEIDESVSVSNARGKMDAVRAQLSPDLRRLAKKFSENPNLKPRRPPSKRTRKESDVDSTRTMLSESLIAGRPR